MAPRHARRHWATWSEVNWRYHRATLVVMILLAIAAYALLRGIHTELNRYDTAPAFVAVLFALLVVPVVGISFLLRFVFSRYGGDELGSERRTHLEVGVSREPSPGPTPISPQTGSGPDGSGEATVLPNWPPPHDHRVPQTAGERSIDETIFRFVQRGYSAVIYTLAAVLLGLATLAVAFELRLLGPIVGPLFLLLVLAVAGYAGIRAAQLWRTELIIDSAGIRGFGYVDDDSILQRFSIALPTPVDVAWAEVTFVEVDPSSSFMQLIYIGTHDEDLVRWDVGRGVSTSFLGLPAWRDLNGPIHTHLMAIATHYSALYHFQVSEGQASAS